MVDIFWLGILRGCPKALQNTLLLLARNVIDSKLTTFWLTTYNSLSLIFQLTDSQLETRWLAL